VVELKVRKIGNSLGVILPKEIVQRLHTAEGMALYLTEAPDGSYRITPYDPDFDRKMEAVEDVVGRYRDTLRTLAK
jgi:putative addiction module antidote